MRLWRLVCGGAALAVAAAGPAACGGDTGATGGGGAGGAGGAGGTTSSSTPSTTTTTTCTTDNSIAEGECHDTDDCLSSGAYCAPQGKEPCPGAGCPLRPCSLDTDCAGAGDAPMVCEIAICCGDKRCVPGCTTEADCPEGQACTAEFHCVPKPCGDEACPANFDCGMGAVPTCTRRACSCDAECDGYCVLGGCHAAPGLCTLPSP